MIKKKLEELPKLPGVYLFKDQDNNIIYIGKAKKLKKKKNFFFFKKKKEKSSLSELKLVRNKKEKGEYFGPINRRWQARKAYDFILKNFKLKLCNRKAAKGGCLDFHLGFCAGPCLENFDQDAYLFRLSLTRTFLTE